MPCRCCYNAVWYATAAPSLFLFLSLFSICIYKTINYCWCLVFFWLSSFQFCSASRLIVRVVSVLRARAHFFHRQHSWLSAVYVLDPKWIHTLHTAVWFINIEKHKRIHRWKRTAGESNREREKGKENANEAMAFADAVCLLRPHTTTKIHMKSHCVAVVRCVHFS